METKAALFVASSGKMVIDRDRNGAERVRVSCTEFGPDMC